ncbi:phage tail tip lysozyme [Micromonospora sp. CA-259024]|uniref:phage tail tip lysozyme n=1 Tax=Micromonospora sp. CA-259024 TaxID=3239965 RepID=UPI003D8F9146
MTTEAEFDRKAAEMRAAGFDPGAAAGPIEPVAGGEMRRYQFALLTSHPSAGLHEVHGLIYERYFRMGGPAGYLGFPTTDESVAGPGRFNLFQFQGAAILWHPVFGVHEVHGRIGEVYWDAGGPVSTWGYPASDEYPDGAVGRSSDFEGGTLAWTPADDVLEIFASVAGAVTPAAGDWPQVNTDERMRYAVGQLVFRFGLPRNGAAGVVGNLWAESGVIPPRIEGSSEGHPLRAQNFAGVVTDFTPDQVMLRPNPGGPRLPGVGLAQWTSASRRAGVFTHVYNGRPWGSAALSSMDAQLDYLASELRTGFAGVFRVVTDPGVTVERASDEIVYNFEVPGAILSGGQKLPRTDPAVQAVFNARRGPSARALRAFTP